MSSGYLILGQVVFKELDNRNFYIYELNLPHEHKITLKNVVVKKNIQDDTYFKQNLRNTTAVLYFYYKTRPIHLSNTLFWKAIYFYNDLFMSDL